MLFTVQWTGVGADELHEPWTKFCLAWRTGRKFWAALRDMAFQLWRTRQLWTKSRLTVDRVLTGSHAGITSMSDAETNLKDDADVQVRAGRSILGFSVSQIIAAFVVVSLSTAAWVSLTRSVEDLAAGQIRAQEAAKAQTDDLVSQFAKALADSEARTNQKFDATAKLAEAQQRNIELQQERTNDRVAAVTNTVESLKPAIALVPTIDARVAAVERNTAEVREIGAKLAAQQAAINTLAENSRDMRADLKHISERLTATGK